MARGGETETDMIKQITSAANPLIKQIRALERKRTRSETGLFIAEGARLVLEAEAATVQPETLLFTPEARRRQAVAALVERFDRSGVQCIETSDRLLSQITRRDNSQNVVAVYRQRRQSLGDLKSEPRSLWVALEEVRDPGNLGTILRTADSVGAVGVILLGRCCDPFSFECVRASMGSIFAIALAEAELSELQTWSQAAGGAIIGTSLRASGRHDALPPQSGPRIVMMGNEQAGLSAAAEAACDRLVRIPMRGQADSLNLAVATAVMLYSLWGAEGYPGARP